MSRARHTPYQLVLFDFDGALADSAGSLLQHLTSIARDIGLEAALSTAAALIPDADARERLRRIGLPLLAIPLMRSRLLGSDFGAESLALVDGAKDLIEALHEAGVEIGVISARPTGFVREALGGAARKIRHYGCSLPMLSKAERVALVLHESGCSREETLLVGDELRDLRAAEENAIACALVEWGFGDPAVLAKAGAAHFTETMAALRALLLAPTPSPRLSVLDPIAA
jgi:phosphoglycolate phosphatase